MFTTESYVDNLSNVSLGNQTLRCGVHYLHFLPRISNIASLRHEVQDWRAPFARVRVVALDIRRKGGPHEVPDPDAFGFDLCSPKTTAFLVEGVAERTMRSSDTTTSSFIFVVSLEDVSGTALGCHDAFGGVSVEGDLVSGEVRNRLDHINLGIEVAVMLVVVQEPTVGIRKHGFDGCRRWIVCRQRNVQLMTDRAGIMR
jgi:hypothetical protein